MAGSLRKNETELTQERSYTWADLRSWPKDELWELIDGVPYAMTTPSTEHQRISGNLFSLFHAFFSGKPCEVFHAPLGVFLPKGKETLEETRNVVIPDLFVICDEKKLEPRGCRGAPDLIVEILSPSSGSRDQLLKLNLYEKNGVEEYWIVDPVLETIAVFKLEPGKKRFGRPCYYDKTMGIGSSQFPGLKINLAQIFLSRTVKEPSPAPFTTAPKTKKPSKKQKSF